MPTSAALDPQVEAALPLSFLATLDAADQAEYLDGALKVDIPPGSVFYRDADPSRVLLVLSGLVRVYLSSSSGRQLTVRYARSGAAMGISTAVAGPVCLSAQAMTDTTLLLLDADRIRHLAMANPRIAWAISEELTRRLYGVLEAFGGAVFGSVRQHLARHLLDLAAERQRGARLVASVSQQDLADAIGTAREVVTRTLHEFRADGLVETRRSRIVLLDPARLEQIAADGL